MGWCVKHTRDRGTCLLVHVDRSTSPWRRAPLTRRASCFQPSFARGGGEEPVPLSHPRASSGSTRASILPRRLLFASIFGETSINTKASPTLPFFLLVLSSRFRFLTFVAIRNVRKGTLNIIYIYMYIYIYVCVCVYMYTYIYIHIYTHIYIHVNVYIYIYTYIYIHTIVRVYYMFIYTLHSSVLLLVIIIRTTLYNFYAIFNSFLL